MRILVALNIQKGIVFDIKHYATDDGPGVRTTIFLKGCPLHCSWCHNPEGQSSRPELMYKTRRCINCTECVKTCPTTAITPKAGKIHINRRLCNLCGICSQKCPTEALSIIGKEVRTTGLMKEIGKDADFYTESGGGVTVSGGEPLQQIDFLASILQECKERGIHTAVDTCGHAPYTRIERISGKTDLFLYDIKTMNDNKHKKYTGASNRLILRNLKRLAEDGGNIQARFPLIPGINDDDDNIEKTAEFLHTCGIKHLSLLPYHRAGIEKYNNLNRIYMLKTIQSPTTQKMSLIRDKLEAIGLEVRIGGA